MSGPRVPIVAYHSIADDHDHLLGHLSLPVRVFERQLQYLQAEGFHAVSLSEIHAYLKTGAALPERAIGLTFDDGYLDNWVFAFPLLKKYGMKATVFMATDFVDPFDGCRPTLEDVWSGTTRRRDLPWWGHLSWPELRAMEASGLVDVQSHTKTHTWHFATDVIVDFHHPTDEYYWLDWNRSPGDKPTWLNRDVRAAVPWGRPVYEHAQTLLRKRYHDDPAIVERTTAHVRDHGGADFFQPPGWRTELFRVVAEHRRGDGVQGRYETDAEYADRVRDEMTGSKQILEANLGTPVKFLSWPCGDYTPTLQRWAIEDCGYAATVNCAKTTNREGDDPRELRRIVFGQDYRGPGRAALVLANFRGNVGYYSGRWVSYPQAPIARRVMRLMNLGRDMWPRHATSDSPDQSSLG